MALTQEDEQLLQEVSAVLAPFAAFAPGLRRYEQDYDLVQDAYPEYLPVVRRSYPIDNEQECIVLLYKKHFDKAAEVFELLKKRNAIGIVESTT